MYSVIMMAALTTAPAETPSFGWLARGHRYWGCGGCYGGCHCYGCGGCYGGCGGCYGGCYGGCGGCYGGCWGPYYGGGFYGIPAATAPSSFCYGGSCFGGCYGGFGGGCFGYSAPAYHAPVGPVVIHGGEVCAKVMIDVPADATVRIDDQPMKTQGTSRTFATPKLQAGQTYYYMVQVSVEREGQTLSETRRVILKPGDEVKTSFKDEARFTAEPTKKPLTVTAAGIQPDAVSMNTRR